MQIKYIRDPVMKKIALTTIGFILSVSCFAQAGTEKYHCSGAKDADEFEVTEGNKSKNTYFACQIQTDKEGKFLVCNQEIFPGERNVENAVFIRVSYGSDLTFSGRRGKPAHGDIWSQELMLKCTFSKAESEL